MKNILLIEDDALVAKIYSLKLASEGFIARVAPDGKTGLEKVKAAPPDLILLDLMLPDINGLDVIKELKATPNLSSIPIIVLSNAYLPELIDQAWKAGAAEVLTKARSTPKQVMDVLQKYVSSQEKPQEVPAVEPAKPQPSSSSQLEAQLRERCEDSTTGTVEIIRRALHQVVRLPDSQPRLNELYRNVHSLATDTWLMGLPAIAMHTAALEALLKKIIEKPSMVVPSVLRTIAQAIDCIAEALVQKDASLDGKIRASTILLVDDDNIILKVNSSILEKAGLQTVTSNSPHSAEEIAGQQNFNLIILDISMPEMNGLELCAKLRENPVYKHIPIVFMSSHADFEHQAKVALKGGNELIAKPCHPTELTVKTLTMLIRSFSGQAAKPVA